MFETLGIFMRWLHIASVATLIGGMLYGWLVLVPATAVLAGGGAQSALTRDRRALSPAGLRRDRRAAGFRRV
jgi:uncharacterized membrane protein